MRLAWLLPSVFCLGCGLLIDLDPPDPEGMDAGIGSECARDEQCDDGDACNGLEFCAAGECIATSPPDCSLPDACHVLDCRPDDPCHAEPIVCAAAPHDCIDAGCDPTTGRCELTPVDSRCPSPSACQVGVCSLDAGCEIADLCEQRGVGTCDPATGNCVTPGMCEPASCGAIGEGDPCRYSYCMDTMCVIEPQPGGGCMADACTLGTCTAAGACQPVDIVTCSDGNPCTTDACDPMVGCVYPPVLDDAITCDTDGDPCTREICQGGRCAQNAPCPAPFNPCLEVVDCATCMTASVPGRSCVPPMGGCGACDAMGRCQRLVCQDAGGRPDAGRDAGTGGVPDAGNLDAGMCPPGTGVCGGAGGGGGTTPACCDRTTQYCMGNVCQDRRDCTGNPCATMMGFEQCCECGLENCLPPASVCPACTPVP